MHGFPKHKHISGGILKIELLCAQAWSYRMSVHSVSHKSINTEKETWMSQEHSPNQTLLFSCCVCMDGLSQALYFHSKMKKVYIFLFE